MKIVEDIISKTLIYQNDDNNICIGYQQKHIVTYHYDSEKRAFIINFKPGNPIPLGAERKGSFFTKKIKNLLFFLLSPEKSSILNMTEQKSKKSAERRRANGSKRAKCNDINKGKVVS